MIGAPSATFANSVGRVTFLRSGTVASSFVSARVAAASSSAAILGAPAASREVPIRHDAAQAFAGCATRRPRPGPRRARPADATAGSRIPKIRASDTKTRSGPARNVGEIASARKMAPHSDPKTGLRKVTVLVAIGPTSRLRPKRIGQAIAVEKRAIPSIATTLSVLGAMSPAESAASGASISEAAISCPSASWTGGCGPMRCRM